MTIPTHFSLEFVTPERAIVHQDVDEVELPGELGYFGVLPGHAPMLAALTAGQMWYRVGAEKFYAFVDRGFAEVLPTRVSVLARVAERADDIDVARAEASKRRAEEQLSKPGVTDMDAQLARIALFRAVSRLHVSEQVRKRSK